MEDGPITGSIFQAPPYTFTQPPDTVQSASNDCDEQPSLFILNSLQEKAQTPRPVQILSNSQNQRIVSSPQSQHIPSSTQHQHSVSSPQFQHLLLSPQSQRILGSTQHQPKLSSPQSQHLISSTASEHPISSPQSHNLLASTNNNYVGAPKIITQPKETMVDPTVINYIPTSIIDNCQPTLGKSAIAVNSPIVGDINPNLLKEQTNMQNFFQILGEQLSRPMFGIPQAIQTVSQTPGISNLVSAPVNLLYTFLQRLNEHSNQVSVSSFFKA
jgi:hypothetical protein